MDIVVSANNNEEILIFPFAPIGIEFDIPWNYEEFESIKGTIQLIGEKGLRNVEINSFWPVNKEYRFVNPKSEADGHRYIDFFEKWKAQKMPIRLVITQGSREIINMACTTDLKWYYDKVGDINYTLILKEYIFV